MLRRAITIVALAGSMLVAGCGGSMKPAVTSTATQTDLFTVEAGSGQVFRFNNINTANGSISPNSTLTYNVSASFIGGMVVDGQADRMFVFGSLTSAASGVAIFDHVSTRPSSSAPDRQITGPATTLAGTGPMTLDSTRDLLYTVGSGNPDGTVNITVFSNGSVANGNVAPARILKMATTSNAPFAMALDSANDRLFVSANGSEIDIYDNVSALPSGTITPTRVLSGTLTGVTASDSIALDGHGRLLVLNETASNITAYDAATANGNVPPIATISNPLLKLGQGMAIDTAAANGGDVYVLTASGKVLVFGGIGGTNGNVSPSRLINYNSLSGGSMPIAAVRH